MIFYTMMCCASNYSELRTTEMLQPLGRGNATHVGLCNNLTFLLHGVLIVAVISDIQYIIGC